MGMTLEDAGYWFILPMLYDMAAAPLAWRWGAEDLEANRALHTGLGLWQSSDYTSWAWHGEGPRLSADVHPSFICHCFPDGVGDVESIMCKFEYVTRLVCANIKHVRELTQSVGRPVVSRADAESVGPAELVFSLDQYRQYPNWLAANDKEYPMRPDVRRSHSRTHVLDSFANDADGAITMLGLNQELHAVPLATAKVIVGALAGEYATSG